MADHILEACTPTEAEVREWLNEGEEAYGTAIGIYRPESVGVWSSEYETDKEAKAAIERIRQQIQQHITEEDYIHYLCEFYDEVFLGVSMTYCGLDSVSEANQRTIRITESIPIGVL